MYLGVAVLVIAIGVGIEHFLAPKPKPDAPAARLLTPGSAGAPGAETPRGTAAIGGPFALVDHTGTPVTDADFRGSHMLIFFGYTYCPDVCPTNLSEMARALDLLGDAASKVRPIFVTVDPERDTPEQMRMYVSHFRDDLIGLTGTPEQIAAIKEAYKVYAQKAEIDPDDPQSYLMDHTANSYLMGPDGTFEAYFPNGTTPAEMAARIKEFL
jgi:protein SCO1/2